MFFEMSLRPAQTIKCGCNKSGSYLQRLRLSPNNNEAFCRKKKVRPDPRKEISVPTWSRARCSGGRWVGVWGRNCQNILVSVLLCVLLERSCRNCRWLNQNQQAQIAPPLFDFGSRLISDRFSKITPAEFSIKAEIIRRKFEATFLCWHRNVWGKTHSAPLPRLHQTKSICAAIAGCVATAPVQCLLISRVSLIFCFFRPVNFKLSLLKMCLIEFELWWKTWHWKK